ncbi:MAG: MFS transporter [Francisella sp.]
MRQYNKILFASLGAAFEFYDFAIYSVFSVAISSSFFNSNETVNNLLVFLVYVLGYILRPIGAWIFGYIADKRSRVFVLRFNMLLLFFSTLFLSFLPTIQSIGIVATFLFISLRFLQSLAIGSEIPVSVVYIIEHYPNRQGFMASIVFCCLSAGIMMTSLVFFILSHFTNESFIQTYGWRIGFFIGSCFTFILFFLRQNITDVDQKKNKQVDLSSTYLLILKIIVGISLVACIAMLTTQLYMFLPTYHHMYIRSSYDIANLLLVGSIIMTLSCLIGGFISDYVSKYKMMSVLILITLAVTPIFYNNMIYGGDILISFIVLSVVMGFFASTYNVIIANLFSLEYRCRGYGIVYNLGYLIFSAEIPMLTIFMIKETGFLLVPMSLIVLSGLISFIGLLATSLLFKKA